MAGKIKKTTTGLEKCPTGISGLDEITDGGLPKGRPTLICGSAGSGKTLFAMEFLYRGATEFNEPGVFMSFEETAEELAQNVSSLGFDINKLIKNKKMAIDYVHIERSEIEETGEYNLEGLFIRLGSMIEMVRAKRVVLDTVEALFGGLPDEAILRAELRRLFRWLKEKKVTLIITGEQGEKTLTRYGIEEYVSDCVIFLDNRITNQIATRRLRIVKYRGSNHGTNEYPTLIDRDGLSVLPISSLGLNYPVSTRRVPTGVKRLDAMLGDKGYYKGSSVLISGMAGTGKSSLAAAFVDAACGRGETCIYFSFEESEQQIIRNMSSVGYNLDRWIKQGKLQFHSSRPQLYGLEMHLAKIYKIVGDFGPDAVIMDPITNLTSVGNTDEIKAMLTRVIDYLKTNEITSIYTSLTSGGKTSEIEQSEVGISSLMDTWINLRMLESENERNRLLYILKSRGMDHSNQMREFQLTGKGINLIDVYFGPGMVLTGSARIAQEGKDAARELIERQEAENHLRKLQEEKSALRVQADDLNERLKSIDSELQIVKQIEKDRQQMVISKKQEMSRARKAD